MSEPVTTPASTPLPPHLAKQLASAKAKADRIVRDAQIAAASVMNHAVEDVSTELGLTANDAIDPVALTYTKTGGK